MTRHGMVQTSVAGPQPSATDPRASMVIIDAEGDTSSRAPGRQHPAKTRRSDLAASIAALPSGGPDIADISRKSKSP